MCKVLPLKKSAASQEGEDLCQHHRLDKRVGRPTNRYLARNSNLLQPSRLVQLQELSNIEVDNSEDNLATASLGCLPLVLVLVKREAQKREANLQSISHRRRVRGPAKRAVQKSAGN